MKKTKIKLDDMERRIHCCSVKIATAKIIYDRQSQQRPFAGFAKCY